jgi:hypothetical protein
MPDHNDQALHDAMTRLLAGDACRSDGRLTVANLAAEAGLTRQQAYRSPVINAWRDATNDPDRLRHPDKTQAKIERLTNDLAAADKRARRYRAERDDAQARTQTLANACRALDEENHTLRMTLNDSQIVTSLPATTGHNQPRTRPAPG